MPNATRIILVTLFGLAAVVGCDSGPATQATRPWIPSTRQPVSSTQPAAKGPEYLNLLEAVFRYQFDHNASGSQRNVGYFFLALDRRDPDQSDPPPELLERFKNQSPQVLPASMAKATIRGGGVKHKDLGGSGLIFNITRITWLDATTAEVDGGYYEGGLSSSSNTYRVIRRGGKWTVTRDKMNSIS